mgnify:CR=1 FL=1
MDQITVARTNRSAVRRNKSKPFLQTHNVILLLMGIVVTITTIAPIVAIVEDTFKIHPAPSMPISPARPPAIPW